MDKRTFAVSALLTALTLVGCSGDDDDDDTDLPDPTDSATPSDDALASGARDAGTTGLEGRWRGTCQINDLIDLYVQRTNEIEDEEYTVSIRSFADESCTEELLLTEIGGTLTTNEQDTGDETVRGEVDLIVDTVRLTPLSSEGADQLNAIALCDRADYEVDVATDIESCSSIGVESLPYTEYDRFLIEGDTLYVGPVLARTPEARSEEVDLTDPYARLPSEGDGSAEDGDAAAATTPLDGRWRGPCTLYQPLGLYQRDTLDIEGASFAVANRTFPDESCTQQSVVVDVTGSLTTNPSTELGTAVGGEIDQAFDAIRVTPLVPEAAEQLNAIAACERTDYTVGTAVDVAGCSTFGAEDLPGTAYDRYLIEDDTLYLGAERGVSPETRPDEVDRGIGYTRLP